MHYLLIVLLFAIWSYSSESKSVCYGTTANGRLENGIKLESSGANFESYSNIASMAGRTYVHSTVKAIVEEAYADLAKSHPNKVYKYGETGFKEGGKFKPHKTHMNGLSVDFMTPMITRDGKSVHLPTNLFNKFGYDIEIDKHGNWKDQKIDFESMGAHIVALHKSSIKHNVRIWRVIFDNDLQVHLFKTKHGPYLKQHVKFSKKPAWVRHDEHYHIDWEVGCK